MIRRIIIAFVLILSVSAPYRVSAQIKDVQDTRIQNRDRWAFKTNALEWLLTIPNFGVEYDISGSVYNRMTVGLTGKWNWNTAHNYTTPMVFNVLDIRPEFRYYWRETLRSGTPADDTTKVGIGEWFRERVFSPARKNPKSWRAYYIGGYVNGGTYSFKFGKEGKQGQVYGLGVTMGYGLPLYEYEKSAIDVELGFSLGMALTKYNSFSHNHDGDYYYENVGKSRGLHVVPFPVISELKVAFVYRLKSIKDKYKKVDQEKLRARMDRKDNLKVRRDSLDASRAELKKQRDIERQQKARIKEEKRKEAEFEAANASENENDDAVQERKTAKRSGRAVRKETEE